VIKTYDGTYQSENSKNYVLLILKSFACICVIYSDSGLTMLLKTVLMQATPNCITREGNLLPSELSMPTQAE
jgi:hypothetical protein